MKPTKLPYSKFLSIYQKVPRFCIDLIIKTKEGIVLSQRDIPPAKGKWHLPGGTLLRGEKLTDAIDRIAKEETGLKLNIEKIIGIMEYFGKNAIGGHTVSLAYLLTPRSGKLKGSPQGKIIKNFKRLPKNTIEEQEKFLVENMIINR